MLIFYEGKQNMHHQYIQEEKEIDLFLLSLFHISFKAIYCVLKKKKGDMKMRFILLLWILFLLFGCFVSVYGERRFAKIQVTSFNVTSMTQNHEHTFLSKTVNFFWKTDGLGYTHVWPVSFHFSLYLKLKPYSKEKQI